MLIIDADMRHPFVHEVFGMANERGLSDCLTNEMREGEIKDMIAQHERSGLHLLTAGLAIENPAELLTSQQMRKLLDMLRSPF